MASLLLAPTVGRRDIAGVAFAGMGETAPQEGTDYPDFVVKGADNKAYLVFGGDYDATDWDGASWLTNVHYLKFRYSTAADGLWLGFAVGAAGDVTGDGQTLWDVLILQPCASSQRHLRTRITPA